MTCEGGCGAAVVCGCGGECDRVALGGGECGCG